MKAVRLCVTPAAALWYALLFFYDRSGYMLALLPAAAVHELGHLTAIRLFRGRVSELRLELGGLCIEYTPPPELFAEVLCILAGPAAGLLWTALNVNSSRPLLQLSAELSLLLSCFNLLPALPLDGGRVLLALIRSAKALRLVGLIIGAMISAAALWFRLYGLLIPGLWLCGFNCPSAAHAERQAHGAQAGRPVPVIRPAHVNRRPASCREKNAAK